MSPAPPKHLDPAISYAADESLFNMQIFEPPLGYHFLKRPYELEPLGVSDFPELTYLDTAGQEVGADSDQLAYTRYTLHVREDARYQPHPAFATDDAGAPVYLFDDAAQTSGYRQIADFTETGSRPVTAADYVYGIKRLADPDLGSPMLGLMSKYIVGLQELSRTLGQQQREAWLNLDDFDMQGLKVIDKQTFTITINGRYPQFKFWLAMSFFAPVPVKQTVSITIPVLPNAT